MNCQWLLDGSYFLCILWPMASLTAGHDDACGFATSATAGQSSEVFHHARHDDVGTMCMHDDVGPLTTWPLWTTNTLILKQCLAN